MDKRKTLTKDEALELVRRYKNIRLFSNFSTKA